VVLDSDDRVWLQEHTRGEGMRLTEVLLTRPQFEGHTAIAAQFLDWLDGGPTPATVLSDNIKSAAMLFGAIESSESGLPVDVRGKVAEAMEE